MQLSIIVPVYNVEEYIEKCILSLQRQDIPKDQYEIIVVNDGSPDNSREVILRLMGTFSNIKLIDQENKGVSIARNVGIEQSQGHYLLFIDADDYISDNSLLQSLKIAKQQQAQITFLDYSILNADGSEKKQIQFKQLQDKSYPGLIAYGLSRGDGTSDPDRSWGILYEKEFLNKFQLRYTAKIPVLEDGEFIARVLCLAERCVFSPGLFYMRTTRPGSAINSDLFYSERSVNGFIIGANNLKKFKEGQHLNKAQQFLINQPIAKFTLLVVQACTGKDKYKQYKKTKEKLKFNNLDKIDIQGCSGIYYRHGLIYNISIDLFYFVWSLKLAFISSVNKIQSLFNKKNYTHATAK